jgi:hypothetical protein
VVVTVVTICWGVVREVDVDAVVEEVAVVVESCDVAVLDVVSVVVRLTVTGRLVSWLCLMTATSTGCRGGTGCADSELKPVMQMAITTPIRAPQANLPKSLDTRIIDR